MSFKFDSSGNQSSTTPERATSASVDEDCAICRDRKVNLSYILPCMHTYCFKCILQWVRIKAICPLCKAIVNKIIHSIKSDTNYKEYDVRSPPLPSHAVSTRIINLMTPMLNFFSAGPTQAAENSRLVHRAEVYVIFCFNSLISSFCCALAISCSLTAYPGFYQRLKSSAKATTWSTLLVSFFGSGIFGVEGSKLSIQRCVMGWSRRHYRGEL